MFDWYKPSIKACPLCGNPLEEWQGKDATNFLLVWQEREPHPIEHRASEDYRLSQEDLEEFTLPSRFEIYSYDCPVHQPIVAQGLCEDGIWISTSILP